MRQIVPALMMLWFCVAVAVITNRVAARDPVNYEWPEAPGVDPLEPETIH